MAKSVIQMSTNETTGMVSMEEVPVQRRSIDAHVKEVFEQHEVGTFLTASVIAKVETLEYPNGERPSVGAVSARLKGLNACTVEGVRGLYHPETGVLGGMKVVEFEVGGIRWQTGPVFPTN